VCKAYDDNGREFPPTTDCLYDDVKKRWYTENHTVEELISLFKDCVVSAPGGSMEYCANVRKRFQEDWFIIVYNNFVEWG